MNALLEKFPKAVGFFEVPDNSPAGAFAIVVDEDGRAWAMEAEAPRPISLDEVRAKGGFACKPDDAAELIPSALF